jgi:formate dehydrogenase iron-sulfur subunit
LSLLLHDRAMESDSTDLVRMTLLEGGAAPKLVEALIPSRPLEPGEQYRFHFDMTKCVGCRSCEIACNEQNGNPAQIKWRRVGELEGGVYPNTQRTYLSMGCNHCISADCLRGCPVNAYTKDSLTGIVLHSADACIGCQYCVWNCPYSVPQFNAERGVVGKCDMCRGRLLEGREPACVNSCPENAIQIEIVNKIEWQENYAAAESPGMPPAGQTISTTRITLPKKSAAWLERVDTGVTPLEHAHGSLVVMTTMMQASFGALAVLVFTKAIGPVEMTLLLVLTAFALNVSVFHLGRPAYAWRALKMWRRSWLSREVLLFGIFFASVTACTLSCWGDVLGSVLCAHLVIPLATLGVTSGLCGTLASAYIYLVKARPSWNMVHTPVDFVLSAALLGSTASGTIHAASAFLIHLAARFSLVLAESHSTAHPGLVAIAAAAWTLNQVLKIIRLRRSPGFERRASYNLLRGDLLAWKIGLSLLCAGSAALFSFAPLPWMALLAAIAAVALGRYLFFVSVVPLSMGLTFLSRGHSAHGVAA